MRRVLPFLLGALLIVVGVVWTLQGLDVVKGSGMSGVSTWAVVGPIVAGLGVALIIVRIGAARRS
ncbi:MAG: hypothetical protein ACRDPI_08465 [Nocardioidaceae bacterium]